MPRERVEKEEEEEKLISQCTSVRSACTFLRNKISCTHKNFLFFIKIEKMMMIHSIIVAC